MIPHDDNDLDVFARTLYGEAEANNAVDAKAIACVVLNRLGHYPRWPGSIAEVCLQPWQFSCWNKNDPGRVRILKANDKDAWFRTCQDIARQAVYGIPDPTNGSTHYYATYVPVPKWVKKGKKTPVYRVKHRNGHSHLFFNDIDTRPPQSPKEALDQIRPLSSTKTVKAATVGGAAATGLGVIEVADKIAPAFPLLDRMATWGPYAVIVILLAVIAFLVWKRIDARKRGDR